MTRASSDQEHTRRHVNLGVGVFLIVNTLLHLPRCQRLMREGQSLCEPTNGSYAVPVVIVAAVLLWMALTSARGRAFGRGFTGALVVFTLLSLGKCTFVWADPATVLWRAAGPARSP